MALDNFCLEYWLIQFPLALQLLHLNLHHISDFKTLWTNYYNALKTAGLFIKYIFSVISCSKEKFQGGAWANSSIKEMYFSYVQTQIYDTN